MLKINGNAQDKSIYWAIIFSLQLSTFGRSCSIKQLKNLGYGLLLLLACLRSNSATAQNFEPLTPDRPQPPQPQPLQPRSSPLNELPAPPIPESVLDIPGKIVVEQFDFTGSTVFSQAELKRAIAEFTGQPISFAQLVQAANAITDLYVEQGYITSGAYVPEQNLESGSIKIQIVEGSLAEIKVNVIEGRLNESYISDRLSRKTATLRLVSRGFPSASSSSSRCSTNSRPSAAVI